MSHHDEIEKTIIVCGNPIDGMFFMGPFRSDGLAEAYAQASLGCRDWWLAKVLKPDPQEGKLP